MLYLYHKYYKDNNLKYRNLFRLKQTGNEVNNLCMDIRDHFRFRSMLLIR